MTAKKKAAQRGGLPVCNLPGIYGVAGAVSGAGVVVVPGVVAAGGDIGSAAGMLPSGVDGVVVTLDESCWAAVLNSGAAFSSSLDVFRTSFCSLSA